MKSPLKHAFEIATIYDKERVNLHQMEFTPPRLTRLFAELTEKRDRELAEEASRIVDEILAIEKKDGRTVLVDARAKTIKMKLWGFVSKMKRPIESATTMRDLVRKLAHDTVYRGKFSSGGYVGERPSNIEHRDYAREAQLDATVKALTEQLKATQEQNAKQATQLAQWDDIGKLISLESDIVPDANIPGIAMSWVMLWNNHRKAPKEMPPWVKDRAVEALRGQLHIAEENLKRAEQRNVTASERIAELSNELSRGVVSTQRYESARLKLDHVRKILAARCKELECTKAVLAETSKQLQEARVLACLPSKENEVYQFKIEFMHNGSEKITHVGARDAEHALDVFKNAYEYNSILKIFRLS